MASADHHIHLLIKEWRRVRGMTQAQLARRVSITPATLSRYETGRRPIRVEELMQIAEVLQVPVTLLWVQGASPDSEENLVPGTQEGALVLPQDAFEDPELMAMFEQHMQALLRSLRQLDPDKPMKEQAVYQVAVGLTTVSRLLWEIVADFQSQARRERFLLQQGLDEPPAASQEGAPDGYL